MSVPAYPALLFSSYFFGNNPQQIANHPEHKMLFSFPLTSLILTTLIKNSISIESLGHEEFPPAPDASEILQQCLQVQSVPYSNSTSTNWANLTTPFNLRLAYNPTAVTLPTTPKEVGNSVVCARKAGWKVQPKGGGHSYASYSTGGHNGSVVVDMSGFDDIEVDQSEFYFPYKLQMG